MATADVRIIVEQDRLFVELAGAKTPVPALWLRERALEESERDPVTGQRLFNPHDLANDLAISDIEQTGDAVTVAFSDGFTGVYPLTHLREEILDPDPLPAPKPWNASLGPGQLIDWVELEESDNVYLQALRHYLERGFVVLQNTPTERHTVLDVAARFGFVRNTNFGKYFEVYSKPGSNDLAYHPVPLGPHTDNPYRDPVPGIQLLHCLINETSGGLSTLVDSLAVCARLRDLDPDGFRLLNDIPVGFSFYDGEADLRDRHTLIQSDVIGATTGIHYSPRLDKTPLLDPDTMVAFHCARRQLGKLLRDPEFELRFLLNAGDLMVFDNNRVLHGRTGYDPEEGLRHLQGCYVDRDGPPSRYRTLEAKLDRKKG
jgi:gamma-butyrobetaine dioxygenase